MDSENLELNKESEFYRLIRGLSVGIHSVYLELDKILTPIVITIQDALKDIDPEKLKKFIENIEKLQKHEPYLTKLINALEKNDNLSHANEALSLAYFIQLIHENEDNPEDVDIFDIVNTIYFNEMFFSKRIIMYKLD